jgi:transposase
MLSKKKKRKKERKKEREKEREREKRERRLRRDSCHLPVSCHVLSNISIHQENKKVLPGLERWLRLRALTAFPEVLSSIPSNHMVVPNHL